MLYKFCPSASGCRVAATISGRIDSGVVSHNPSWTGYWTPLPVSGGNTIIIVTLSLTHAESVYVVRVFKSGLFEIISVLRGYSSGANYLQILIDFRFLACRIWADPISNFNSIRPGSYTHITVLYQEKSFFSVIKLFKWYLNSKIAPSLSSGLPVLGATKGLHSWHAVPSATRSRSSLHTVLCLSLPLHEVSTLWVILVSLLWKLCNNSIYS